MKKKYKEWLIRVISVMYILHIKRDLGVIIIQRYYFFHFVFHIEKNKGFQMHRDEIRKLSVTKRISNGLINDIFPLHFFS